MPKRSISSLKRVRQNKRRRAHNQTQISKLKTQIRKLIDQLAGGNAAAANVEFLKTAGLLDRAAARGQIHRNTASRKKGRLAKRLRAMKPAGK